MQAGPLVTIVLVGGFVAGALGGTLFSPSIADSNSSLLPVEAAAGNAGSDYEQQLLELGAENAAQNASIDALRATIRDLEGRRPAMMPPDQAAGGRRPLASINDSAEPFSQEEEARFGAYLDRIEAQKEEDREKRQEEQRAERLAQRMERYTKELGLDTYQSAQMARVLEEQDNAMRNAWSEMREAGGNFDRTTARTAMEEMRTKTNEQLGQFLTTTQLESYSTMSSGGFGGRGSDRGGRGGGDAAGGGGRGQGGTGGGRGGEF
ncbi:MAG: hypothetical protein HQ519_11040 [Planctomycetes bacterium]|nr:hypothetical protein [Planctomycetota bacterium]